MIVLGFSNVTKKNGEPAVVINCGARRSNTSGLANVAVWTDEQEIKKNPVKIGDQIRSFREGGYMVLDGMQIDLLSVIDNVL